MLRQILTLFVLAIALDSSLARVCFNGRCYEGTHPSLRPNVCRGPHQHWSRYGGCDKTCKDLDGLAPCSTVALGKCLCNDGYVRKYEDGTGPCIPPHRCPHRCPKHQHWSRNVGCEKTCFDLNGSRACSLLLKAGCKCDHGYVRRNKDGTGPCIRPSQCHHHHRCPKHEHWTRDKGCEKTCGNLGGNRNCPLILTSGCKCNNHFVRKHPDGTGPCIPPSKCPHRCPKHEHWTRDKGCEKTCGNLGGNRNCPLILTSGCKCNRHLVRKYLDGTGPCIPPSQCPRCPGRHERWDKCRGRCQPTCGHRYPMCDLMCSPGCVCKDGFVRRGNNGPCIRKRDCPHRCPKHEHWTRDKGCEKTCGNLGGNRNCPLILTSGCKCNNHFVRKHPDGTGPCIPPSKCPHRCPKHEHWTRDKGCEKTCGNLGGNRNCPLILTSGCTCNRHFVRKHPDGTGPCIPPSQCPRCPGRHERWDKCRGRCQPTCGHRYPMCDLMCSPGCVCKDGFVRRGNNGPCIRKRDCPN
ncbi:hypothetical protein SSS_09653 [Sarcoptes scabiei]|uniref:TIL domain-containing protein n=1 Tax=Sarcoptes scabiei TaxID=52283 RepID=A0A834RH42_SARSC|nr:hypothetical protein SSS_09653 [Sarcoptes scabiei]